MMVKIVPVTDEEKDSLTKGRSQGRVSWAIIQQFEESKLDIARLDSDRNPESLSMVLRYYIKNHSLPYRISVRKGKVFIMKVKQKEIKELTTKEADKHD